MKKSRWNDTQLIEILQNMPQLKDKRSPHTIYQHISSKKSKSIKRKKIRLFPVLASVAAMSILLFMVSDYNVHQDSAKDSSVENVKLAIHENAKMSKISDNQQFNTFSAPAISPELTSFVVNKHQLAEDYLVTIGLPVGDTENIVPLSVLVSKQQYDTQFIAFNNVLNKLNHVQHWGLSPFRLSHSAFSIQKNNKVIIDVTNESIPLGSASENEFLLSIQETFRWMGFDEAVLIRNDGKKFELSQYGQINDVKITKQSKKGFFLFKTPNGADIFLVPYSQSFPSFNEALSHMDESYLNLSPSIPSGIKIKKTEVKGNEVIVSFQKGSKITNNLDTILMLYAIMLTARDFGYHFVTFTGTQHEQIGEIKINVKNEVPVAPNLIHFP